MAFLAIVVIDIQKDVNKLGTSVKILWSVSLGSLSVKDISTAGPPVGYTPFKFQYIKQLENMQMWDQNGN